MSPEAEYFTGYLSLKAIYKREGNNQGHNTNGRCRYRQAYDEGRKGAATVECQFSGDGKSQFQINKLCCKTTQPPTITQNHFKIM